LLIAAGADVNGRQSFCHPLVGAMLSNDKNIMEKLLAAGARVDAVTRINETPLQQYPLGAWKLAARSVATGGTAIHIDDEKFNLLGPNICKAHFPVPKSYVHEA
jgi:hypothetical protein